MTSKTEDDVAREKDAVQKMIGAKGAMEAALKRIERLEGALRHADQIASDMRAKFGDGLYIKTYYHGESGGGEKVVSLKSQVEYLRSMIAKVL